MRLARSETERDSFGIRAGDFEAVLTVPAGAAPAVRSTFADLVADVGPHAARVVVAEVGDRFAITVDGALWSPGPDQTLCDQLVYVLLRASLDAHPERLHVHCGGVSWRGRGVLLGGLAGSGKSTLTVHLVEQGFDYATDERVAVRSDLRLVPFTRPISLAEGSFPVLAHLDPRRTGAGSASARLWHVPASAVRAGSVRTDLSPVALVFVQREERPGAELTPLHPVEAVRLLLSDSADAARFGAAAVPLAARLCASLQCGRLVFGDERAAVDRLREALDGPPRPAMEVHRLAGSSTSRAGPGAARGVSGVVVGDRCVLHRAATGEIIELDRVMSVWFQLFDGRTPLTQLVGEVAEANDLPYDEVMGLASAVLQQLVEIGVAR